MAECAQVGRPRGTGVKQGKDQVGDYLVGGHRDQKGWCRWCHRTRTWGKDSRRGVTGATGLTVGLETEVRAVALTRYSRLFYLYVGVRPGGHRLVLPVNEEGQAGAGEGLALADRFSSVTLVEGDKYDTSGIWETGG